FLQDRLSGAPSSSETKQVISLQITQDVLNKVENSVPLLPLVK
uniref:Lipoprotein n=1 Tax=Mesocestoides corti TaxID=53468 RepID=A0A5K3EJA7_MESCO